MSLIRSASLVLCVILNVVMSDQHIVAAPVTPAKPNETVRQLQKDRVQALKEALVGQSERVKV
ncbi:MAG TPA: hypothetical protein VHR66_20450, partial [Gemmataceae bacterium]|nr:hypothetical protein [Gemmataceae bacterium]